MEIKKGYLTIKEAETYTGISWKTLYQKVREGVLTAYKPGKNLLFKIDDLDRFIKKHPAA